MAARLPSLNGLKVFECTARHMSFTRAAQELHVTQTAVSHQIRRLEDELGTRLFHRNRDRLELSEAGQAYLQGVSVAFEQLRFSTGQLLERREAATLSVATLASFASKWLLPRLGAFRRAHPGIDIRVGASTDLVDFAAGGADVAIRYGSGEWKGVHAERLMDDVIFPVCSPALLSGGAPLARPADLARHTLLQVSGLTAGDWRVWLDAAGVAGPLPGGAHLSFDLALLAVQAAVDGHGVCIGRRAYVEDELRAGRLVAPFGVTAATGRGFYLVSPAGRPDSEKVAALRGWLRAEAGEPR